MIFSRAVPFRTKGPARKHRAGLPMCFFFLKSIFAAVAIPLCIAQQIQEGKGRNADQFFAIWRTMCSVIIRALGHHNGRACFITQFANHRIIRHGGLFTVFYFDQDLFDVGIINHHVNFLVFFPPR